MEPERQIKVWLGYDGTLCNGITEQKTAAKVVGRRRLVPTTFTFVSNGRRGIERNSRLAVVIVITQVKQSFRSRSL